MNDRPMPAPTSAPAKRDAPHQTNLSTSMALIGKNASPVLQIMLDEALFDRARMLAGYMAKGEGMMPKHLIGKPEACFAVICQSITWKLDPYFVARCTYQTPGGNVGFEGKLVQAVLENSGKLLGPVTYEHYGDWDQVQGKWERATGGKGGEYAKATWNDNDAKGLGVIVRAQVFGEAEPRAWKFDLVQAYPRNSTLWATDPRTQICYTAVRRFANIAAPGLLAGVPFDREEAAWEHRGPEHAKDVSEPVGERPRPEDYEETAEPEKPTTVNTYDLVDEVGEVIGSFPAREFDEALCGMIAKLGTAKNRDALEQLWNVNEDSVKLLIHDGEDERAKAMRDFYLRWIEATGQDDETEATDDTESAGPEADEDEAGEGSDAGPPESGGAEPEPASSEFAGDEPGRDPPTEYPWRASDGRVQHYKSLQKWTGAVVTGIAKADSGEKIDTARRNNGAFLAELHSHGTIYAAAVREVEAAMNDAERNLVVLVP